MYRYRRIAIIISAAGLATAALAQQSAQDSGGWRRFGTASNDQAYAVNQGAPPQNSQAPQNYAPAAPVPAQITLPAGTFVRVRINEKLSSDKNQAGDLFTATLVQPLIANGLVIAQPGQNIAGRVSEAVRAKDGNGRSRLGLDLTELSLVDGQQVPIRTQLIEYHRPSNNGRDTSVEAVLTFRTIDPMTIATDRSGDAFQPVRQYNYQSQGQGQVQPRQSAVAPPAPYYDGYYGGYGGYYDPYFYPYGGFYGPGFGFGYY